MEASKVNSKTVSNNIKKENPDITYSDEPEYYENFNEVAIHSKIKVEDKKKEKEEQERYRINLQHYLYSSNKD